MIGRVNAQQIDELFQAAVDQPPERRTAFLERACRGNGALRQELERLLAADDSAGDFLDRPAREMSLGTAFPRTRTADGALVPSSILPAGTRIGRYTIARLIGGGGMGDVYAATQDQPQRTVALKLLRGGTRCGSLLRRFEFEAELLGRLAHPGIAQVYEAGTHHDGAAVSPFIAMEYVGGATLLDFVDQRQLDLRRRLALFAEVCDAVQYGHQKGVIHRDLKPGNILVVDAEQVSGRGSGYAARDSSPDPEPRTLNPQPKVIDFGVARLLSPDAGQTRDLTSGERIIGTLAYMSPEQLGEGAGEADARSDLYSLGVVLYELVCGQPPYEVRNVSLPTAVRTICDKPPAPPSLQNRALRGDVETILLKALEKAPARRYASAAALADDVRRFLAGDAINARPPTLSYQLSRLVRRHKAPSALAAVLLLTLALLGINEVINARRIAQERDKSAHVLQFLQEMLASAHPVNHGQDVTVVELLDQATSRLHTEFAGQPELEATVRGTIGRTYLGLDRFHEAEQHLSTAIELLKARGRGDSSDAELAELFSDLGELEYQTGRGSDAMTRLLGVIETQRRLGPSGEVALSKSLRRLGELYTALCDYKAAEPRLREALEIRRRLLGDVHPDVAAVLSTLAQATLRSGDFDEAERLARDSVEICRKTLPPGHANLGVDLGTLALVLSSRHEFAEAAPLYREAIAITRKQMGPDSTDLAKMLLNFSGDLERTHGYEEAESLARESKAIYDKALGPQNPLEPAFLSRLGSLRLLQHDTDAAEGLLRSAVEAAQRYSPSHPIAHKALFTLSELLLARKDHAAAEEIIRRYLALKPDKAAAPWMRAAMQSMLGDCVWRLGRCEEARPLLLEAYQTLQAQHGKDHAETQLAAKRIERFEQACGPAGREPE